MPGVKPEIAPSRKRRAPRLVVGVVALLLLSALAGWLYITSDAGRTRLATLAINSIPLEDGYQLSFLESGGSLPGNVFLGTVTLTAPDGETLLAVDSLTLGARVLPLLQRRVELTHINASGVRAYTRQGSAGDWDLVRAFPTDTVSTGLAIRIGSLLVDEVNLTAVYRDEGSERTLVAGPAHLSAHDIRMVDTYGGRVDSLILPFTPPSTGTPASLRLSASYFDSALQIREAVLLSPHSNVIVQGGISTSSDTGELTALLEPLSLADISPFLPTVDPDATLRGRLDLTRDANQLLADGTLTVGGGGSVSLSGTMSDSVLAIEIDALNLAPATIATGLFSDQDRINGTVRAALQGETQFAPQNAGLLSRLSGPAVFELQETTLPSVDIAGISGRIDFDKGAAGLRMGANLAGSPTIVTGRLSNLSSLDEIADSAKYDLVVTLKGLDAARANELLGPGYPATEVHGRIAINGEGIRSPTLDIRPTFADSRVGPILISRATGAIAYDDGALGIGVFRVGVDSFSTATVDVRALQVVGTIDGQKINYQQTGSLNGAPVAMEGLYSFAPAPGGQTRHSIRVDHARVRDLRLDDLPGIRDTTIAGFVNGSFSGDVTFTQLSSISGQVDVDVDTAAVNSASVRSGQLIAEADNGELRYEFALDTDEGTVSGSGSGRPFDVAPRLALSESQVKDFNVGAFAGLDALQTSLNGSITAATGETDGQAVASIRILPSAVNGVADVTGELAFHGATATNPSAVSWDLISADGAISGEAEWSVGEDTPRLAARVRGQRVNVADWWPATTGASSAFDTTVTDISFVLSYEGELPSATRPGDLDATLVVDSLDGTIAGNSVSHGVLNVAAAEGVVDVRELFLETSAGVIQGAGPIVLGDGTGESAFYLDVNAEDLSLVGDLIPRTQKLGGIGSVTASVTGPPTNAQILVDGAFGSISYGERRSSAAELFVDATYSHELGLQNLDARFRVVNLIVGSAAFRETQVQVTKPDSLLHFQAQSEIDSRRDASVSGTIDTRPGEQAVSILGANLRLDNDRWSLLQPSTLTYGEAYRIRNLLLFTDDQQIAVDGIIDLDGDQSLILTVENFRIGAVADLLGYSGLDGTVNGYLDLVGPSVSPTVQGDLQVELEANRKNVGNLDLAVGYDSLRLRLDGYLEHVEGGTMNFVGLLPVDLRLASTRGPTQTGVRVSARQALPDSDVDLTVSADSFSVGWILPFLDPAVYSRLDGRVDGDMRMLGTFAEPLMSGAATIRDGRVGLPIFGTEIEAVNGRLLFEDRNILIDNLSGRSGRGPMNAVGSIELANLSLGQFDVSIDLEDFLAIDNADYRAATSGDLLLYGTTRQPVISGYLRLQSLDIFYKGALEEFEPVTLTDRDLRQVELVFGRRVSAADTTNYDFYTALEIDVNVEMTRDSWMRSYQNPRMEIPFFGSLDVAKQPSGEMEAFGTIDIIEDRGQIVELGRRFNIDRGTVTFNGPLSNPRIDLVASYTVNSRGPTGTTEEDIEVNLAATGSLQDLDLTLTSDPAMETTDILSYVLLGRPARESLQFGSGEESLAADIALSQAAGFLEGLAGEELGLDVVRIEYEGTEVKLTAGKYLRSGVYVAISQPIVLSAGESQTAGSAERELLLEVEIIKGLLARAQQQGTIFGINLFWQYAY